MNQNNINNMNQNNINNINQNNINNINQNNVNNTNQNNINNINQNNINNMSNNTMHKKKKNYRNNKNKNNMNQNMKQVSIEEGIDFLTNGAFFPIFDLDADHHYIYTSGNQKLIGPPLYPKYFMPPIGWTAIALKVSKKYDGGNDKWLGNSNLDGEWYIGYHGVKTLKSINNIFFKGFRIGSGQYCKDDDNTNPLTKDLYPKCGEGVYFSQDINDAKSYSEIIQYSGDNYRVVFMCRLNPKKVRIANKGLNKDYMIVNGDEIDDMFGKAKIKEVRPYKILLLKE